MLKTTNGNHQIYYEKKIQNPKPQTSENKSEEKEKKIVKHKTEKISIHIHSLARFMSQLNLKETFNVEKREKVA